MLLQDSQFMRPFKYLSYGARFI
ncbi:hypothetical protein EMIT0P258_80233 [Pseudomonas sp. IT-P258]